MGNRGALSWLFVCVMAGLCATLGILQYRWIGEASRAERERLRAGLQTSLQRVSQDFTAGLDSACAALSTDSPDPQDGSEQAYTQRYNLWRSATHHDRLFRRIALAVPSGASLELHEFDPDKRTFHPVEWPPAWSAMRENLTAKLEGGPPQGHPPRRRPQAGETTLIDLPHFARGGGEPPFDRPRESEWLLVELDLDYVRTALLPELVQHHLGSGAYQVEAVARTSPGTIIYQSDPAGSRPIDTHADASVGLYEPPHDLFRRGPPRQSAQAPPADRARWVLSARHRAGSLDAVVEQARVRNVAVTAAVLVLMLAAIGALVRFTQRSQRLAELQVEFVAGVSHELRTPLSVIRTAAHNLGGGVITGAAQVQRYGALIADQTDKLTRIVEQVLLFSATKAGKAAQRREAVAVDALIEDAVDACARTVEECGCRVEKHIEANLPPVLGDPMALRHVLQNLLNNAAKHGTEGAWIGISASSRADNKGEMIEIRVADRGMGIPANELNLIFDPFYRGKRAVDDQIHGTGLGLSLVKRIVEAHCGTVIVKSEPGKGTEFVIRIPAAPADLVDEFADTVSRG